MDSACLRIVLFGVCCYAAVSLANYRRFPVIEPADGAILVTGASTGIGRAAALAIAEKGYHVFAGVRSAADGQSVEEAARAQSTHAGVEAVMLDVTDAQSIGAAVETVRAALQSRGLQLAGLVNNAGIAAVGAVEFIPNDRLMSQYEVNVFGLLHVTQAFLPLLRASGGRVVNVGSIAGRVTPTFHGTYSSTKFAVEGLTDAMRREFSLFNVSVSLVEPGVIDTPIQGKMHAGLESEIARLVQMCTDGTSAACIYADGVKEFFRAAQAAPAASTSESSAAIVHALTSPVPSTRYLVGWDAFVLGNVLGYLPDRIADGIAGWMMRYAPEYIEHWTS